MSKAQKLINKYASAIRIDKIRSGLANREVQLAFLKTKNRGIAATKLRTKTRQQLETIRELAIKKGPDKLNFSLPLPLTQNTVANEAQKALIDWRIFADRRELRKVTPKQAYHYLGGNHHFLDKKI